MQLLAYETLNTLLLILISNCGIYTQYGQAF